MQQRNFSAGILINILTKKIKGHSSNSVSSKFQIEHRGKSPKNNKKLSWNVLEEYKKLCLKSYVEPNPSLIAILKNENLILNPDFTLKEIIIINKLIGKYLNYKTISVETNESLKGEIKYYY